MNQCMRFARASVYLLESLQREHTEGNGIQEGGQPGMKQKKQMELDLITLWWIDLLSPISQTPNSFNLKLVQYFKTNLKPIFEFFFK